ncbi:hypothetical protein M1425_0796 [Sulfolobus islandicus M.14.25]|uniref:Uncharacterized protein n=3 Tax=Saccharolobus islandicus TaxID=43080 RepID=C3MWE7_SACI4|nr:hypothetical protein M1425_0796 [Sulfolobus islandicus M.14.25]ACP54748.1 hypothetical protein M1627_0801 [Sulfolobus islandicus M.16.27]
MADMGKIIKESFKNGIRSDFFKQESFKEGIYTSFFATIGLGIFYYLNMEGLSLIFTIPLIIIIFGLTILVILGLERMAIQENGLAQLFLNLGFALYDVPASLGYLSYFAYNDIALIFNLSFEFAVFITVFISIIFFIIMYYNKSSKYFIKFKYYYTLSLLLLIPLLGIGNKIQVTGIDWIGLTLFAMVGFTPIINTLKKEEYLNSLDKREKFVDGLIIGFLLITIIIISYILISDFNIILNVNPKIGKLLVGINGLIAYLAFSTSFVDRIHYYIQKYINVNGNSKNVQQDYRTEVLPLIKGVNITQILFNSVTISIIVTILIDIILGAIILILRFPVHRYLIYSGLIGGSFQYIIPITIYILNKAKKKK